MTTILGTGGAGQGNSVTGAGGIGATSGADPNLPASEPTKKIRVLLVDDESIIRKLVIHGAKTLRPDKFEFVEASNSAEALDVLKTDRNFSLIISDKDMPQENDGLVLANNRPKSIKFILVSANADKVEDTTLGVFNIDRKVQKPINMKDLFNIVDAVLTENIGETPMSLAARTNVLDKNQP